MADFSALRKPFGSFLPAMQQAPIDTPGPDGVSDPWNTPETMRRLLAARAAEQAGPDEAGEAQAARQAAADRITRPHGTRVPGVYDPAEVEQAHNDTDDMIAGIFPFGSAARAAYKGDYATAGRDAAIDAALTPLGPAGRFAKRAAVGLGAAAGLLMPSNSPAEAEATHFPMVTDENVRKGLDAQWNQKIYKNVKGGRIVDKAATEAMQHDLVANATKEVAARAAADADRLRTEQSDANAAKLKAGQASDRYSAFMSANRPTLDAYAKSNPARLAEFNAAMGADPDSTIAMKMQVLQKHAGEDQAEAARKAKEDLPFVQRFPEWAMPMEGAAIALGAAGPGAVMLSRANRLKKLAAEGDAAIAGGTDVTRMQAANRLKEATKLGPVDYAELAAAPLLPWAANTVAPAAIDAFRFNGDFEHSPALQEDMRNLDPREPQAQKRFLVNMGEGVASGAAGLLGANYAGAPFGRNFKSAAAEARASLNNLKDFPAVSGAAAAHQAQLDALSAEAAGHASRADELQSRIDAAAQARSAGASKAAETRKAKADEAARAAAAAIASPADPAAAAKAAKPAKGRKRTPKPFGSFAPDVPGTLQGPDRY